MDYETFADLIKYFNNREIASFLWLSLLFVLVITKKDIRRSFFSLVNALLHRKIAFSFLLMGAYTSVIVYFLEAVSFWDFSLIKDLVVWFFFSGTVLCFSLVSDSKRERTFKEVLKDNFKLLVVIEFLVGTYTFPLVVELVILPTMSLVVMAKAYSSYHNEYRVVEKVMGGVEVMFGGGILAVTAFKAVKGYNELGQVETLRSFLFPILMTTLFLPFVYFASLYSIYENIFIRFQLGYDKDKSVIKYGKAEIIKHFSVRLNKLKDFSKTCGSKLLHIQTKSDVDELLKQYKI